MPVAFVMMAGRRAVLPHLCSASSHLVYILQLACIIRGMVWQGTAHMHGSPGSDPAHHNEIKLG